MRFLTLFALLTLMTVTAGQAGTANPDPERFGAAVTKKKSARLDQVARNPERWVGKVIRLEGTVKEACQGRGCWVEIASPSGATFMARSLDETILVPKDCAGRKIVVQGVVKAQTAKGHDHGAETEGHACPSPTYVLSTQGIELAPTGK